MSTGLALAGLLALATTLAGCDVVDDIVGRLGGRQDNRGAAFAAMAGGGFGGGFGGQATALPVVTAEVGRETVSSFLVATTTLTPDRAIDVVARAAGAVVSVLVQEGDPVREGQLLARLDQEDARLALAEAQAHYENIQREHARTAELAKHGGATDQELENQRYQIELRTIALDRARQQLDDTEVRSPLAGIVAERMVEEGATISANTRLFHVLDPDPLLAVIHIPESGRQNLSRGQSVVIQAASDLQAAGVITRISPVVDAQSGTVKVTVELDDSEAPGALLPGTFVTVQVPTETRPDALVVPKRAILLERDQNIVYRVQEGAAVRTPVVVGLSAHDLVEITSGLSAGEVVVTVGQESLRDGAPVRAAGEPLPETAAAAGAAGGQRGGGGGGFDISQMPAERRQMLVQRLLANPEIKKAYDEKLKEDPSLANDPAKRLEFFREQIAAQGGLQVIFGGGGGRGGAGAAGGGARQGAAGAGGQASAGAGQQTPAGTGGQQAGAGAQPTAATGAGQAGADAAAAGTGGARGGAAAPAAGGRRGAGGGGPGGGITLAQLPEDRRERVVQRLLQNAEVKKAYDEKLKEDPSLENDEARRLEFLQEQLQAIGGFRALFGGGGGGGGGFGN